MPAAVIPRPPGRRVALVTLGCARNEVDSEELAGRLLADGWELVPDAGDADVTLVNTCGFVEAAKKDSIDTVLQAADLNAAGREGAGPKRAGRNRAVVAVGCLAERYGEQLAEALPEADAVLGFDDYADISLRLRTILDGGGHVSHTPRDRRTLLPISPVDRQASAASTGNGAPAPVPGGATAELPPGVAPASGPRRLRLGDGPTAPLKLASGCDRRCTFCAIPSFRGSYLSRRPADVLAEARWLGGQGVREVVLVSENSTSYGKDLGDLRLLETLLPELAAVEGVDRVRVSYLQPAEMRPTLVAAMTSTEGVLRRMRRFGDTERFLGLLATIRDASPEAGIRSNVIVGFPGETEADVAELERFLGAARLDAVGVFGYSDEDGTEAADLDGKLDEVEIRDRTERITRLAEELVSQRAEDRVGQVVRVLVESVSFEDADVSGRAGGAGGSACAEGRAEHQAPEVDGSTTVYGPGLHVGALVGAVVVASDGVDLVAEVVEGAG